MGFFDVFNNVKQIFINTNVSDYQGHLAIQINLTGDDAGIFYAEINNGKLSAEPYEYYDRDVLLIINSNDFLDIVYGKLDPIFAFTIGKLKVEGNIEKALELKRFIKK